MPITSTQMAGLVGGQQAMFGNMATYAAQISPFAPQGMAPTYTNPMAGADFPAAGYAPGQADYMQGAAQAPGMIGAAAAFGAPALGLAGMAIGGPVGGMLDPMTGAMRGLGRGVGWKSGAGWGANLGRVMSSGIGGIARGIGLGAIGALPGLAISGAIQYAGGQMMEGAEERNQTLRFLQQNFRFANPQARGGFGFRQEEQEGIHRTIAEMGGQIGTTVREMQGIMGGAARMGVFQGVRDAKEFQAKFKETVGALTEIAKTFNTTLNEAMPMFGEARRQGFWTPQDITRHAQSIRQVQATTGMSAHQAQQYTGAMAQVVQGIGGTLQQGSNLGARMLGQAGAAAFAGSMTDQQLQNAGFGTGTQGVGNFAMFMGQANARFASSRVGRWALAAMMNRSGDIDPELMQRFSRGEMGVGELQRRAERNVGGPGTTGRPGGAEQFLMNEEELRGQFAEQGGAEGFVRRMAGSNLWGTDSRSQLITRRMIQRFLGGDRRQADMIAQRMRDMPRILATQAAQTEQQADMIQRQQQSSMDDTWQGITRKVGQWWRQTVTDPLKEFGANLGAEWSRAWQSISEKVWGGGARPTISGGAIRGWVAAATSGNMATLRHQFGTRGLTEQVMGRPLTGMAGVQNEDTMRQLGIGAAGIGMTGGLFSRPEMRYGAADIRRGEALAGASRGEVSLEEARAMGYGSTGDWQAQKEGAAGRQYREFLQSNAALRIADTAKSLGGLPGQDRMKIQRQMQLAYLQSGAAGADIQKAVSTGDQGQNLARMLSYMNAEDRRGRTGDVGFAGPGGGLSGLRGRELMERIEQIHEGAAIMLGGGPGGIPGTTRVTGAAIKELADHPDTADALKLMHDAQTERDPKKASELKAEALRKLNQAGNNNENGLSESARKALLELGSGSAMGNVVAGTLGAARKVQDSEAIKGIHEGRMQRLRGRLGEEGTKRLNDLSNKTKLGKAITAYMGGAGGAEERYEALKKIAEEARTDPKAAARALDMLSKAGSGAGAEEMIQTIMGAQESGRIRDMGEREEAAAATGKGAAAGKARGQMQQFLGYMGISGKDTRGFAAAMVSGTMSKETKDRIESKLREQLGWKSEDIKEFLKDAQGGLTTKEKTKWANRFEAGRGISVNDPEVAARRAKFEESMRTVTGRETKTESLLQQQLRVLEDIKAGVSENKTGQPASSEPGGGGPPKKK